MKNTKCTLPIGAKLQSPKRVYTVEQVLGQGGFGITYKVSALIRVDNVTIRTSFAVKEFFMKESCERDSHDSVCYSSPVKDKVEESKRDFLAEAQRLNKISLEHLNLIHVNEVFEANNTVYYVMEYLDGGSLRNYVRQHGALSEHEALEMMNPIFKAVDFLHQNRMIHLDIKPDNIMLKRDADSGKIIPVLIDFGLSKHYDKNGKPTSSIRILGCSDGYAPMEQYVGINTFTPQADVYALAATLLFTLTGKDPVIATELSKEKIVNSLPGSVSSKVKEAIVSAMKMRKEERTQEVRSLLNSLDVQQEKATHSESVREKETKTITLNKGIRSSNRMLTVGSILFVFLCFGILYGEMSKNFNEENTVKNAEASPKSSIVQSTRKAIDLGLSVKWGDCNWGASKPEEGGYHCRWTKNKKAIISNSKWIQIAGTKYDGVYTTTNGKWRMPTKEEVEELLQKCTYKKDIVNGVPGMTFKSKVNGNSIFLPTLWKDDYSGFYWTGNGYSKDYAGWGLSFSIYQNNTAEVGIEFTENERLVRPVTK